MLHVDGGGYGHAAVVLDGPGSGAVAALGNVRSFWPLPQAGEHRVLIGKASAPPAMSLEKRGIKVHAKRFGVQSMMPVRGAMMAHWNSAGGMRDAESACGFQLLYSTEETMIGYAAPELVSVTT